MAVDGNGRHGNGRRTDAKAAAAAANTNDATAAVKLKWMQRPWAPTATAAQRLHTAAAAKGSGKGTMATGEGLTGMGRRHSPAVQANGNRQGD